MSSLGTSILATRQTSQIRAMYHRLLGFPGNDTTVDERAAAATVLAVDR